MELKRLPFVLGLVALALAVAVEAGIGGQFAKSTALRAAAAIEDPKQRAEKVRDTIGTSLRPAEGDGVTADAVAAALGGKKKEELGTPGEGIPSLAILDGLLLFTVALLGLALVVPERLHGRVQGIATLVVSISVLLGAIAVVLKAIVLVSVMIGLLLAVPFGTIAYLAKWGAFEVGAAEATLGVLLVLKLALGVCLLVAQPRFLQNKGLVLLVLTALLANVVVSFLLGFPPRFLASITDVIGAIVVAILAAIWAIVFLVGSIVSIVKVLQLTRGSAAITAG
ncbi:MAG TPA: hypothetical protein VFL83_22605 [Anaeromyxobacter sp.]|nr:hypothetical protein [Anaeromyxobacter sp.]